MSLNKPELFITLFEGQLIRTYLASDNGDLISRTLG